MDIKQILKFYQKNNKTLTIKIHGNSMLPCYENGVKLNICLGAENFQIGDVILFYNCKYIIHRIVGKKNGCFITKGDNNLLCDEKLICKKDIIGYVRCKADVMKTMRLAACISYFEGKLFKYGIGINSKKINRIVYRICGVLQRLYQKMLIG